MAEKTAFDYVSEGLDYFAARKLHEAAAAYQEAIRLDETFVEAHLGLGKVYEIMGALDEAIEVLQNAAKLCPMEPLVHTSLSQCFQKKGMIPEAEQEMAVAMQLQRRS
jgi:tetratricopeptide (TPR) repeat protein